jgi:hypothetical protein
MPELTDEQWAKRNDFMGRIFLCPESFSPPDRGPQFWVNIGYDRPGDQIFPQWVAEMESAASKDDYDAFMKVLHLFSTRE